MIRQDEYEKEYAKLREFYAPANSAALIEWRDCLFRHGLKNIQIHNRAIKDELASRLARESIHELVDYDS